MDEPEGAWMTKAELARVRGISIASAYRLIRRQGWRRQPGNDGKIRALVPSDWVEPREADQRDSQTDRLMTKPSDTDGFVRLIEAAIVRADEANKRADAALVLVDRTVAELADAGERADRLERDLAAAMEVTGKAVQAADGLRADLAAAQTVAEQARAEARKARDAADELRRESDDRRARGRLRRAWDGWRGR
jgi:hypothetical protein